MGPFKASSVDKIISEVDLVLENMAHEIEQIKNHRSFAIRRKATVHGGTDWVSKPTCDDAAPPGIARLQPGKAKDARLEPGDPREINLPVNGYEEKHAQNHGHFRKSLLWQNSEKTNHFFHYFVVK